MRNYSWKTLDFSLLRRHWPAVSRFLPLVLIVVGITLLTYVGVQYWTMYSEQQKLSAEWERQNQVVRQKTLAKPGSEAIKRDALMRLMIPRIEVDAFVVNGTSYKKLLLGPGLLEKSPAPGEGGNAVITAHRDTFFRNIYELKSGDEIVVKRAGRTLKYAVTGKRIVKPTDVSVIRPADGRDLTLITCYPTYYIGPAPDRLVVFSKLVEDDGVPVTRTATGAGGPGASN